LIRGGQLLARDEQWAAIAPHLPMVHTGPERQDDRRVISGIIHRLREGCRWRALPDEYGPYTTVFNRYNRWSKRGLWQRIFAPLVECSGPPSLTMIDGSAVKAHRSSIGARKGGIKAKASAARRRAHDENPRTRRRGRPTARLPADGRPRRRHYGRGIPARCDGAERAIDRRQGL
jgi:transposase